MSMNQVRQNPAKNLIAPGSNAQNPLTLGSVGNKPGAQAYPPLHPDKDFTPNGLIYKPQQRKR
jgi:hypothetical protein